MNRVYGIIIAVAALALSGASAQAQSKSFDAAAKGAVEVQSPKALAALFWAHQADCSKAKSDLERRQCAGIRAARLAQISSTTYLVKGDAGAFSVGEWDAKTRQLPISVHTCIACVTALDVDGASRYVVGAAGSPKVAGGAVKASRTYASKKKFKSERAALRWKNNTVPRLMTQFLVRVPDQPSVWAQGGAKGFKVKVVGYRVFDPCDGEVICAKPHSAKLRANQRACSGEPVVESGNGTDTAAVKRKRKPWKLSTRHIKRALRGAQVAAQKCYDTYGVPGTARFRITISDKGDIVGLEQKGDFVDTPTGTCVEKAVKITKFPETRRKRTTLHWPIMVR